MTDGDGDGDGECDGDGDASAWFALRPASRPHLEAAFDYGWGSGDSNTDSERSAENYDAVAVSVDEPSANDGMADARARDFGVSLDHLPPRADSPLGLGPSQLPPRAPEVALVFCTDTAGARHAQTRVFTDYAPPLPPASVASFRSNLHDDAHDYDDEPPRDIGWNDRGNFWYEEQRRKCRLPALVETGRHAGRSQVKMRGRSLVGLWTLDMFTSMVELPWRYLALFVSGLYLSSFLLFASFWYALSRTADGCVAGFSPGGFNAAVIFSVATQMTIGYGTRYIVGTCRTATFLLLTQSLVGIFVDALSLGLIFARITDPKHRTRSVFISDAACVACRDGELKFMFRVADVRDRKVIQPRVRACLYTWNERRTHEGEHLPVTAQEMVISKVDPLMLLPITVEHVIDENSPLYRHTHESLVACNAEVVVSFEGCIDTTGLSFSARQSFLPREILWGHTFRRVIRKARPGEIHHEVTLQRFHELEPQRMLESDRTLARCGVQLGGRALLTAQQMCEATLEAARGGQGRVPYPAPGANTLVVSDVLVLAVDDDGRLRLSFRVGDTRSPFGSQFAGIEARAYLHRWNARGGHAASQLAVRLRGGADPASGAARLSLRVPAEVDHVVDDESPLRRALFAEARGAPANAGEETRTRTRPAGTEPATDRSKIERSVPRLEHDAEIVVEVEATITSSGNPCVRRRCYRARDVKFGRAFENIVSPPARRAIWTEPSVDYERFHDTIDAEIER
jgi:hypothetical protein